MSAESSFVLEALSPRSLTTASSTSCLGAPAFAGELTSWERTLQFAEEKHSLLPFLAVISRTEWKDDLLPEFRSRIESLLSRERMRLALLDSELENSLGVLRQAEVPVMVLKGMDLGRRFYPGRLFRPMADVDLLVGKDDFPRALAALERDGYRPVLSERERNEAPLRPQIELSRHDDASPTIELHWSVQPSDTAESIRSVWKNSIPAPSGFFGSPDRAGSIKSSPRLMAREDLLPYLIRHCAVQHLLESPIWLLDLHFVIDQPEPLNWNAVLKELARTRSGSAAFFVLQLLNSEWKTPVPEAVLKSLAKKAGVLRRAAFSQLSRTDIWFADRRKKLPEVILHRYLFRENLGQALAYGLQRLF